MAAGGRYAAVDLGASSGRVLVGELDGRGGLTTAETARFANRAVPVTRDGVTALHWDLLGLWAGVRDGLWTAGAGGGLTSVGVDSWAVDHGLLDADGALLGNPYCYRDARTAGVPERVLAAVGAAELYRLTGLQVQPFNTVFQLVAAAGSAQLAAARRLLLVPDLLGHWLTGATVAEVTNASTTGLLDPTARAWSRPVLEAARRLTGVDVAGLLPPLVEPGTVVGELLPAVAGDLGLAGTRVVAVGSHDTASAVAAVPMTDPTTAAYISSGTWSLVGVELEHPVLTEAGRAANLTNELGVAGTVRYLRNVPGLWLLTESLRGWAERGEPADLAALLAQAAEVPGLRCVVDVDDPALVAPGDMPARVAAAAARAGQPMPGSPAEVVRCILDSLALAYRRALRQVAELSGRRVAVVHVVGGGSRNALLCRLTADATGLPVVAGPVEGTAIGNLLVQAMADGALPGDLGALRAVVRASTDLTTYHPTPGADWDAAEHRLHP